MYVLLRPKTEVPYQHGISITTHIHNFHIVLRNSQIMDFNRKFIDKNFALWNDIIQDEL